LPDELFEIASQLISPNETPTAVLRQSFGGCRIRKALMQFFSRTEEDGAGFAGIVADGNYIVEVLPIKFRNVLGPMRGDIYAKLLRDSNCLRPYEAGVGAGALDFERFAGIVPQKAFGHLAPGINPLAR
jgi:hypothetical protein